MSEPTVIDVQPTSTTEAPIAVALGGGAARGLAHVPMIEAFDELGIRPSFIAGTSMGAIVGACWASGMRGVDLRAFALELFEGRTQVLKRIVGNWPGRFSDLMNPMTPALVNAESLIEVLLPPDVPKQFEALAIPFAAVATDFSNGERFIMETGPLVSAIAGSSAIPALLKPVERDDRILIDGGIVDPTPFEIAMDRAPFSVAVDVTGVPSRSEKTIPSSVETVVGSTMIMLNTVMREKLQNRRPDVLILPEVGQFRATQFFRCAEILKAADAAKDELKRALEARMEATGTPTTAH